jgi:pimeloyl-ACP methyl ester carboxylesterase
MRAMRTILNVLICMTTIAIGQDRPQAPYPAPGRLVDVGGWRLHLNCTGEARSSQPTVILEGGLGDFSVEWSLVQPGVAKFARVCSYDRAGDGWSDLGPHPRTLRQIVYELHTLLEKGGVTPPLVLVGHSYGGWLVRLYAATYKADVAGMVLVDAGADDPWRMLSGGKLVHSSELVKGEPVPEVKVSNPLRLSEIPPVALSQMKAGAQQLASHPNEPPRDKLPIEAQRMRGWALGRVEHIAASVNPFEIEELADLRARRTATRYPLGDMPLVVLTRGVSEEGGPDSKAFEAEHRQDHTVIAQMSRNGKMIVAERSGHHIQLDEPQLVIETIRGVLAAAHR